MTPWACGIVGCDRDFETAEGLIRHQVADHPSHECKVCGRTVPAGYLAIRHAFEEHTRAEYVRAYDADSDDIRAREQLIEVVEEAVDVTSLVGSLESDGEPAVSVGD
jgi:hypothetical protein